MTATGGFFDRLRQPEYTGENRCMPCTVVNTLIAIVLSVGVALAGVWSGMATLGGALAGVIFGLSMLSIYLRGYLVPKTPELTKQYFPDWLLERFGKDPDPELIETEIDPEAALVEAGALEECPDRDDLCLTEGFRAEWYDEIDRVDVDNAGRDRLLELLGVDEADVRFQEHGSAFLAKINNQTVGKWESQPAFTADLGAANVLAERYEDWERLPLESKSQLLNGLRLFLDACPGCGGVPEFGSETVESCCSTYEVAAVSCTECESRLFETPVEG